MLGAIIGDIIGSPFEWNRIKTTDFPLFSNESEPTDDSVLTIATAAAILTGKPYRKSYRYFAKRYPHAGYGGRFKRWLRTPGAEPCGSLGNGSAMRVSPVGWLFNNPEDVRREATLSAECTHNHPEGVRGAVVTALLVYSARTQHDKEALKQIMQEFDYETEIPVDEIRPTYRFDVTCAGTVPPAFRCVYEAGSYEEAVRLAVSLGGDSDTLACVAGSIAEAMWGIPAEIEEAGMNILEACCPGLSRVASRFKRVAEIRSMK